MNLTVLRSLDGETLLEHGDLLQDTESLGIVGWLQIVSVYQRTLLESSSARNGLTCDAFWNTLYTS